MSNLAEKAATAKEHMEKQNPSAAPGKPAAERKRIPLSVPQRKLEVPTIPGYKCRWFRGTPSRLAQAERAFYEYVSQDEIKEWGGLNDLRLGGDATRTGNTDMGSRVTIADSTDDQGNMVPLVLMKQKMEYYTEDRAILQERNDSVVDALTAAYRRGDVGGRAEGETAEDAGLRYVDKARSRVPEIFRRKRKG